MRFYETKWSGLHDKLDELKYGDTVSVNAQGRTSNQWRNIAYHHSYTRGMRIRAEITGKYVLFRRTDEPDT